MADTFTLNQIQKQVQTLLHRLEHQQLRATSSDQIDTPEGYRKYQEQVEAVGRQVMKLRTAYRQATDDSLDKMFKKLMANAILKLDPEELLEFQQSVLKQRHASQSKSSGDDHHDDPQRQASKQALDQMASVALDGHVQSSYQHQDEMPKTDQMKSQDQFDDRHHGNDNQLA